MYNQINITKHSHPAEWALILRCFPSYRKRRANIIETESTTLTGRYWDDGSKSIYRVIHVHGEIVDLGDRSDYPFTSPDVEVDLTDGTQVVQCGIFCGRPGLAYLYRKPAAAVEHKCNQCGKDLGNEWLLGSVCGKCCRKNHKQVAGRL